jgi:hypothetical protein
MPSLRQFASSYLRVACVIIGVGCLLAAANVGRLALAWRTAPRQPFVLAVVVAVAFTVAGGVLIRLGWRAPWLRRHER